MKLADELRKEHELIERVLGAFYAFAAGARGGAGGREGDGASFLAFFRGWAGTWHHGREEDTLFAALTEHAELAPGSGPVRSLHDQHREMARVLEDEIAPALARGDGGALEDAVGRYARALLAHIDAENSVLLPEGVERLRRSGILELPSREPTAQELAARDAGERLAEAYPAREAPGAIRGEGCVICPSYGLTCDGLEQEWWTDAEWDAFEDRQG